jgi:hypothetical protein
MGFAVYHYHVFYGPFIFVHHLEEIHATPRERRGGLEWKSESPYAERILPARYIFL